MKLKDFLKKASKRERADVAEACNDSVAYLYQIAGGHRFASPLLALKIEQLTAKVALQTNGRLCPVEASSMVRHSGFFCNCCKSQGSTCLLGFGCHDEK